MALTLTFVSTDTINIANDVAAIVDATILKCDSLGAFTLESQTINVPASSNIDVILGDGFYRVSGTALDKVFYIYKNILEHLKADVKEILLVPIPTGISSAGYDLTVLSLLANLILGNTTYHNVAYNAALVANGVYAGIANIFAQTIKYIESSLNSSQSTLPRWLV